MAVDERLLSFIKNSLEKSRSKEDIIQDLTSKGWAHDVIETAFNSIAVTPPAAPQPVGSSIKPPEDDRDDHKKAVRIIVTVGAALVGLGVYSFLAVNWQELQRPLRLAIIVVAVLLPYGIGWYLKEVSQLQKIGNALILLGTLIYGGAIFLIARMYDIHDYTALGFILWMIGTLAIGFVTKLYQIYFVAIFLAVCAFSLYPRQLFSIPERLTPHLTSTVLLILATVLLGFVARSIYKEVSPEVTGKF